MILDCWCSPMGTGHEDKQGRLKGLLPVWIALMLSRKAQPCCQNHPRYLGEGVATSGHKLSFHHFLCLRYINFPCFLLSKFCKTLAISLPSRAEQGHCRAERHAGAGSPALGWEPSSLSSVSARSSTYMGKEQGWNINYQAMPN